MKLPEIDWSVFDGDPKSTCFCRCGAEFRSHAKLVKDADSGSLVSVTREPCPKCESRTNSRRISSEPEQYIIRG